MFSKIFQLFLLAILSIDQSEAQSISYELVGEDILYGDIPDEIYICDGVLHNSSQDSIEVMYSRVDKATSHPLIFTSICTDFLCYTTSATQITEFIPPGDNYKCEMRWTVITQGQNTPESGNGTVRWAIYDVTNSIEIDTIQSEFIYDINTSTTDYDNSINIFPNPANQFLNFEGISENSIVHIYSNEGKLVIKEKLVDAQIDVENLEDGLYFGSIQSRDDRHAFKFIKF